MEIQEEITIVMPVYQPGEYLRPCLESLLKQTFRDFCLICIDDASPDDSHSMLQEYAKKDSRIVAWRNPYHLGAARTRNIGIQMAQGKYLIVLDADDYFESNYLEELYKKIEDTEADIVICTFYWRSEETKQEFPLHLPAQIKKYVKQPFTPIYIGKYFFQIISDVPFCKIMKLDYIRNNQFEFQDLENSNDVYFSQLSALKARKIAYIDKPLIHYRFNLSSTSKSISSKRGKNPMCFYYAIEKIYEILISDPKYKVFLRSFHDRVILGLNNSLSLATNEEKEKTVQFLLNEGFKNLSMTKLKENDFLTISAYLNWNHIINYGFIELRDADFVYELFFEEIMTYGKTFALWGYGKDGKKFLNMAKKYNFPIREIYDCDSQKWDDTQVPPIKDFSLRNHQVDTIIYTNPTFSKEISDRVQSEGANVRLVDYVLFELLNIIGTSETYEDE